MRYDRLDLMINVLQFRTKITKQTIKCYNKTYENNIRRLTRIKCDKKKGEYQQKKTWECQQLEDTEEHEKLKDITTFYQKVKATFKPRVTVLWKRGRFPSDRKEHLKMGTSFDHAINQNTIDFKE